MRPRRSRRPAAAGFTLIELVVVLAIMATAVLLVAPAIRRGAEARRLRASAGQVAALLREARYRAVADRRPTRVVVEARDAVSLAWDGEGQALRRVDLPPPLRLEPAAGGRALVFSARGLARDARWIVEGPAGRQLAVELHGVTGRVTVAPAGS